MKRPAADLDADSQQARSGLLQKLAYEGILAMDQFMQGAVEDQAAFREHQESRIGVGFALGQWDHVSFDTKSTWEDEK